MNDDRQAFEFAYAHVLPGMQTEAAARLDSIMEKALGQLGKRSISILLAKRC